MVRKIFGFFVFTLLMAPVVQGAQGMKEALATLPSDAVAVLVTPSFKQLDADYQQLIKDLQLEAFVTPPANSLVGGLKMVMPQFADMDENGPVALVVMPFENYMEIGNQTALAFSANDPKAMLEKAGAKAGEGGVWEITLMGKPSFAATGEKRLYLAATSDAAKKVAAAKPGLDSKLKPADLASMEGLDVALWVDGDRLLSKFKPQIDSMIGMYMMLQGASPFGAKQAESTKKQIDMLVNGVSSLTIGVSLEKTGFNFRFASGVKPGTELAKHSKIKTTKEPLLTGLPGERYMITFGQVLDPEQAKTAMEAIEPYVSMLESVEGIDKTKVGQLKSVIEESAPLGKGVRAAIEVLPAGPDGLFGLSMIIDSTDAKKSMELTGKLFDLAKSLVSETKNEKIPAELQKVVNAITYSADVETIAGNKVAQLKIDLAKAAELDEEDAEEAQKIVGKDGPLVRFAALESNVVVVSFGGGAPYMERLMQSAKKNESKLDSNAGIKKVAGNLPSERNFVAYADAGEIVAGINHFNKTMDDEPVPFDVPPGTPPLAMSSTGGAEWTRFDLFLPTELMIAGKNAIMKMTGAGGMAAAGPPSADATPTK